MEAYTSFAEVYDNFMDNIPYEEWSRYVIDLLHEYGIEDGIVADLGCGTGAMTRLLKDAGYDMIGIDNSMEMLDIAREKEYDDVEEIEEQLEQSSILYLLQDMREFELYGTVAACVSVCDCVNYITEPEDLTQVFALVNNYLDPEGIFIFDFHPESYYRKQLGDKTIAEDREDMSFIWDNHYDEEDGINEYDLSIFVKRDDNLYEKYTETHYQRAYLAEEIAACIEASGLKLVAMYDAFTKNSPTDDSERIYVIAMEQGKKGQ